MIYRFVYRQALRAYAKPQTPQNYIDLVFNKLYCRRQVLMMAFIVRVKTHKNPSA